MRKGDEVLSAAPGAGASRTSVEFFEVPIHTI